MKLKPGDKVWVKAMVSLVRPESTLVEIDSGFFWMNKTDIRPRLWKR